MGETEGAATEDPGISPVKPTFELLDDAPLIMRRPLALIGEHAYAAIWPHLRITQSETSDREGKITTHDPPLIKQVRQLCVVRSDGTMFGPGERPLSELGFNLALKEIPPDDKLWSTRSAKAFGKCELLNPREVFNQVVDVIARFIDFDRSLAEQQTMAELVACSILSTWFLEAFNVIGFLWPNGEAGSGKSQLLSLIAEMGYLGQMILAGGSYASLRDLADYGATLCFDDAENVADVKRIDADKRALLLAGNRRGNSVSVKEPDGERGWRTRYVNTYCMRAFSAIRLPDRILATRTIVVPLIRTADPYRANADPLEYSLWPHNRRTLLDSLWAMALANLADLSAYETRVNQNATLSGRNLEPWRAALAVAAWLQDAGVSGLYERLERLSVVYQSERQKVDTADLVILTIRALCKCLKCDLVTLSDLCDVRQGTNREAGTLILSAEIANAAKELATGEELDVDLDQLQPRQIGRLMRTLRFEHGIQGGTHRKGWFVSKRELASLALSYGIVHREPSSSSESQYSNVTNVTEGHKVTEAETPHDSVQEIMEGNALAWQAQAGF
jgi:hypothetical protein